LFVERIQTAFGRLAELAADVAPASAMTYPPPATAALPPAAEVVLNLC
jgi:hypothetical protein